ncbi:MAG: hypothetical protein HQL73_10430, partial [Magnetococcales bacterium]|nr:hypothetical protein [Magnetococcales bacterium]
MSAMQQTPSIPSGPRYESRHPVSIPPQDDALNFLDFWRILFNSKWLILFFAMLGGVGGVYMAMSTPPIYRTQVLMEPVAEDHKSSGGLLAQYGGLAALAGIDLGGSNSSKGTALAILSSYKFIEGFLKEENLIPILYAKRWDLASQSWKDTDPNSKHTLWDAVHYFKGILKVTEDKKTNMIVLAIEWRDREQATQWANLLVERINHYMMERTINEATKGVEYLKNEWTKNDVVE